MGQCKGGGDYDPHLLFQEYKERVEDDFNDPELDDIEMILKSLGFVIEVGDQGDYLELWQDGRLYRAFVTMLLLVDSRGDICDSTEKIIAKTPAETELVFTEKDAYFLHETGIKW